ncbi:hypothetical protein QFZ37_000977 [Chryseobacterium ginsenosidimutans]|uniref:DUF6759 domain-containing protein n=1 Tax=Chryseobacterium ginsenosidimutans TaxID=687846 RepID=UPI002785ED1A|nr:DUF6759 domain-containing protein [Chryseobacterium ginsenosidimutans]MDQ0592608.1 hypothetical protein [Chryseobacterium ginsenosidimutans]
MRKLFPFIALIIFLNSCETAHYRTTNYPVRKSSPTTSNTGSSNTSATQTEIEYQALIKTYKSETAEVLTDLLNGSEDSQKTSITVENNSRCNMVLTISGNNYFKKIPIAANKIGSAMVLKNQNYNISGMICNSVYQKTKFVTSSYNITLSN